MILENFWIYLKILNEIFVFITFNDHKIIGKIAKETCGNGMFFEKYKKFYQMRNIFDFIRELNRET